MDLRGAVPSDTDSSLEVFLAARGRLFVRPFITRRSPSDSEVLEAIESREGWVLSFLAEPERRLPSIRVADLLGVFELLEDEEPDIERRSFFTGAKGE
jgi:hypothetical protein